MTESHPASHPGVRLHIVPSSGSLSRISLEPFATRVCSILFLLWAPGEILLTCFTHLFLPEVLLWWHCEPRWHRWQVHVQKEVSRWMVHLRPSPIGGSQCLSLPCASETDWWTRDPLVRYKGTRLVKPGPALLHEVRISEKIPLLTAVHCSSAFCWVFLNPSSFSLQQEATNSSQLSYPVLSQAIIVSSSAWLELRAKCSIL